MSSLSWRRRPPPQLLYHLLTSNYVQSETPSVKRDEISNTFATEDVNDQGPNEDTLKLVVVLVVVIVVSFGLYLRFSSVPFFVFFVRIHAHVTWLFGILHQLLNSPAVERRSVFHFTFSRSQQCLPSWKESPIVGSREASQVHQFTRTVVRPSRRKQQLYTISSWLVPCNEIAQEEQLFQDQKPD